MPRENVVITGVGVVSAIGIGAAEFFEGLLRQSSGIRSLSQRVDGDLTPSAGDELHDHWIGAPIVDFEPKQHVRPRKALKVMSREVQLGFASAHLAIKDAGLQDQIPASEEGEVVPRRLGTVYGGEIFFSPPLELADTIRSCLDDNGEVEAGKFGSAARKEVMPLWMLKYLPNMPACQVGISINSQGPNNSLVLGDVSGPAALVEAQSYLDRGIADVMLVGSTGTRIGGARLSYRKDSPIARYDGKSEVADLSRPHDPGATGVVGGEGAASLVVETAGNARKRGATILGEVVAMASRFVPTAAMQAGKRSAAVVPECSRGAEDAIRLTVDAVLSQAGVSPAEIGLVVSHACGDRDVDAAEARAIVASGIKSPLLAVSASIGHTGAASGMMGLAAGVLALASRKVPPTRHGESAGQTVRFANQEESLSSPLVLCLSSTTEGNAIAVLLKGE